MAYSLKRKRVAPSVYASATGSYGKHRVKYSYGTKVKQVAPVNDSVNFTSGHFDQKQMFRAKRSTARSRRLKRKRAKFDRRILKISELDTSPQDLLIVRNIAHVGVVAGNQGFDQANLLGSSTSTPYSRDLTQIMLGLSFTVLGGTEPVYIMHSQMDWTLQYTGSLSGIYGDMYEFVCRKDMPIATYISPQSAFVNGFSPNQMGSGSSTLSSSVWGADPFQSKGFTEYFKITKVTRFELTSGSSLQGRIAGSAPRLLDPVRIAGLAAIKGWTRGVLPVYWGAIDPATASPSAIAANTVSLSSLNTYRIKCKLLLLQGSSVLAP